jgi:glucose-6-phosphate 1-dehydrogenase
MIDRLVIFGAAGDLTGRYLMPALARLLAAGAAPGGLSVLGVALEDWDRARFRSHVAERLSRHAADVAASARDDLGARLDYRRVDVTDAAQVAAALAGEERAIVAYLALPPAMAAPTIEALHAAGIPAGSRIVVEKPFGVDLASAESLNRLIARRFSERAVFRVDHFLMKQTIQNVLGLRFANRIFEPIWNRDHVARVELTWDESGALDGRAGYYDRAGALRDMIQNHLLQLACLVGMEPPLTLDERDLRDRKVDLLRAVRRLSPEEVARLTVRARYGAGRVGERTAPAYVDEPGVDPARDSETFAQVTLFVDNWRWSGVPFVLRTGKALARDRREIVIEFRPVPHLAFEPTCPAPNVLRLQLDPDRMSLALNVNGAGDPFELEVVELDTDLAPQDLPAYARLLVEVLRGDLTLAIRGDEAEESWRIVEPILAAWERGVVPLGTYPAGSDGPAT